MSVITDADVLDHTEDYHDRIDFVTSKPIMERATVAGELNFRLEELRKRDLTDEQRTEVNAVRYRLYVECLGVPKNGAQRLLTCK